jgi:hypothetical protein
MIRFFKFFLKPKLPQRIRLIYLIISIPLKLYIKTQTNITHSNITSLIYFIQLNI